MDHVSANKYVDHRAQEKKKEMSEYKLWRSLSEHLQDYCSCGVSGLEWSERESAVVHEN